MEATIMDEIVGRMRVKPRKKIVIIKTPSVGTSEGPVTTFLMKHEDAAKSLTARFRPGNFQKVIGDEKFPFEADG